MKLHLFFSLFATFLLTACGGSSSSEVKTELESETELELETTENISSFSETKQSLEENGYSIESLATSSKVQAKVNNNELRITYDANKSITLLSSSLYLVINESNESVFATLDVNSTADKAEAKTKLYMEQNLAKTVIGYVNINTTLTEANASIETILAEVESAFKQFTLHNVTAPTSVVENEELNISYQTALQNQDKTFTCNAESKVLDAQKGYSTLSDLSVGKYVCKHGDISLLGFTVTVELISLNLNGATVSIADNTFDAGTIPSVRVPAFPTENIVGDGNISVTQTLNGEAVETGRIVRAKSGENTVVYTISETAGDKESKSVSVSFTLTSQAVVTPPPSGPSGGQ